MPKAKLRPRAAAQFKNKVVVITGASSGIGLALAKHLAAAGAALGLVARRLDLLTALKQDLTAEFGPSCRVEVMAADVTDRDKTLAAFARLEKALGPADVLIANAGIGQILPVDQFDSRIASAVYNVNVMGVLHAIEAVLPSMLQRGSGHLVGMASLAAYRSFPQTHAYSASKAALRSQLDGLRLELAPRGIAVTTLCPGFIRSPMTAVNNFKMPWLMDVDVAAVRMLKEVAVKAKVVNFPRRLYWLIKLSYLLPEALIGRLATPPAEGFKRPGGLAS